MDRKAIELYISSISPRTSLTQRCFKIKCLWYSMHALSHIAACMKFTQLHIELVLIRYPMYESAN